MAFALDICWSLRPGILQIDNICNKNSRQHWEVLRTELCLPGLTDPPREEWESRMKPVRGDVVVPAVPPNTDRPDHSRVPEPGSHLPLQGVLQFLGGSLLPVSDFPHQPSGGDHSEAGPGRAYSTAQLWPSHQEQQGRSVWVREWNILFPIMYSAFEVWDFPWIFRWLKSPGRQETIGVRVIWWWSPGGLKLTVCVARMDLISTRSLLDQVII